MHTNKKLPFAVLSVLALVTCLYTDGLHSLWVFDVAAQGGVAPSENIFSSTANLAIVFAMAMQTLSFVIFYFLQYLLDPLFILDLTGVEALRSIWKYSRDIMNVIFAFMLIFAGIYTVVSGNKELVQQKYKRFILAVILVNFSWFFPRVILDVANVLTATVYQIPAGLGEGQKVECVIPGDDGENKPCQVVDDMKFFSKCTGSGAKDYKPLIAGIVCAKWKDWSEDTNTAFGMINGLVMNYAQLPNLTRVLNPAAGGGGPADGDERFQEYLRFLMHVLFVLVLMAMLFLPLAAMFVVFIIRIPIMWFTIAFMPFMFMGFVMGDKMGQFDTMKIFQHYIKAAFLPTIIAIPFAVGFMILSQFTKIDCAATITTATDLCKTNGPFLFNVNTPWQLMIMFMTFFVIWSGFWMALKIDDIYVNATSSIQSFGNTLGKTAIKVPLSVPFIPTDGGKKMSILGVDDKINSFNSSLSSGNSITDAFSGKTTKQNAEVSQKVSDAIRKGDSETNKALTGILDELKKKKARGENVNIDAKLRQVFENKKVKGEIGADATFEDFKKGVEKDSKFSKILEELRKPPTTS